MKKSRLSYDEWKCIVSKEMFCKKADAEFIKGYIGLMEIKEVSEKQI